MNVVLQELGPNERTSLLRNDPINADRTTVIVNRWDCHSFLSAVMIFKVSLGLTFGPGDTAFDVICLIIHNSNLQVIICIL